jgi:hypothetical protein
MSKNANKKFCMTQILVGALPVAIGVLFGLKFVILFGGLWIGIFMAALCVCDEIERKFPAS